MTELDSLLALDDDGFRAEVRHWIEGNYPGEMPRYPSRRLHFHEVREWYARLSQKGWLAPAWPREHGGMGLPGSKQLILLEELERFGAARVNDQGLVMLAPLLIRYGTEAQKAYFLPRILSGEHIWAQAYSEPDAGSDLAALRLHAEDRGDHWLLNGQKTWVTLGGDANWVFLLARTNREVKKQLGISFLLASIDTAGITVRPIVNLDMGEEFSEIFFENVRVPKENIIGEVDQGWTYAKALLGFERIAIGSPTGASSALKRLWRLAVELGRSEEPEFVARYTRFRMDLADLKCLYGEISGAVRRGEPLGGEVSIMKIVQTELFQRISEAMLDFAGDHAGRLEPLAAEGVHPAGQFIFSRPATIFGGSSEILRNIVARSMLDLPS